MTLSSPLHEATQAAGATYGITPLGVQIPSVFVGTGAECKAAHQGVALFDLSHRGRLELTGKEAAIFLHNLSSQDIKGLPYSRGREAFFCNVQARVLAWGVLWHVHLVDDHTFISRHDSFWIDLDPGIEEKLVRHLERHRISEIVDIARRTSETAQFHLAGPRAPALLAESEIRDLSDLEMAQAGFGAETIQFRRNDRLGVPGFDIIGPPGNLVGLWEAYRASGAVPAGSQAYEILRLEAGLPEYGVDMEETHLAPEVDRTARAISYQKGCYLGQEPIVRIRDLGHVNRLLRPLRIEGDLVPARGTKLFSKGAEGGEITSAALSPTQGIVALGYIRRAALSAEANLVLADGRQARVVGVTPA